jgi:hypothetical protein
MKTYQSVLPAATRKAPCKLDRTVISNQIRIGLADVFSNGFWYCDTCESRCERVEGENGQPSHCDRCGSPQIDWNKPAWLLEPGDLSI